MARRRSRIFSERELQVMKAVWKSGNASVNDVRSAMGGEKAGAYTSIATMLKFLESKGALKHKRQGRAFYYIPVVTEEMAKERTARYVLKSFFDGNFAELVEVAAKAGRVGPKQKKAAIAALGNRKRS